MKQRKSRVIPLTLLSAAAALSTACQKKQVSRCIDPDTKQVVSDDKCDHPTVVVPRPYPYYRWYFGGQGYFPGQVAAGGTFDPAPDATIYRASTPEGAAVIRGGFGSWFVGGGS